MEMVENGWNYCGSTPDGTGLIEYMHNVKNDKIVNVTGRVWVDNANTKDSKTGDELYGNGDRLLTKEEIESGKYKVYLLNKDKGEIASTSINPDDGTYTFTDINYWDLVGGCVKFDFDASKYATVTPFVYKNENGNVVSDAILKNSKAQEENLGNDNYRLSDEKIKQSGGMSSAITKINSRSPEDTIKYNKDMYELTGGYKVNPSESPETWYNSEPLTSYYNYASGTYSIDNINLGLVEKVEPSYDISEQLAYIRVKLNGFTYTYLYDSDGDLNEIKSDYVPTVQEQLTKSSYSFAMYPSDVAYSANQTVDNKMQVYVVYKINVTNTTNIFIDKVYYEQKLKLSSLENNFDTTRYELSSVKDGDEGFDFGLWYERDGKAIYSLDSKSDENVYADGITNNLSSQNTTISSYIKFKIKDKTVEDLLEGNTDVNKAISNSVNTEAYHEYTRRDNLWNHNDAELQRTVDLNYAGSKGDKKYTHESVKQKKECKALGLKLKLGEERILKGTVFEDERITKDKEKNENTDKNGNRLDNLGNGINDSEENKAEKVAVQLVDINGNTVARYPNGKKTENKEPVFTKDDGTFEMPGVVPGYYYLQYTYGDGSQKIVDKDGKEIDVNLLDYKSTIVTDEQAKNAMQSTAFDGAKNVAIMQQDMEDYYNGGKTAEEVKNAKDIMEWYKESKKDHSVASDDINVREKLNGYEYREDGSIYNANNRVDDKEGYINATDENGTVIVDNAGNANRMTMSSYTPMVGISIENDKEKQGKTNDAGENEQKPTYEGFNLGIIKETEQNLIVEKKITNIELSNSAGVNLVNANPTSITNLALSDLDGMTDGGSKYAKIEMEKDKYIGTTLKPTYKITITNNSYNDYVENEGSEHYGWYFKYGEKTEEAKLKETVVKEVTDELDKKFEHKNVKIVKQEKTDSKGNSTNVTNATINPEENNELIPDEKGFIKNEEPTDTNHEHITITDWAPIEAKTSTSVEYTTTALLSEIEEDTVYNNAVRISKLKLDRLSTLNTITEIAWGKTYKDKTTLTVVPNTGENRSNTYIIVAAVALLALGTGFIILKKKVLK